MFDEGLAELHTHLGGSVASEILWSLAHEQGIALPVKDYWEFDRLVTVCDPRGVADLDALDAIYHWTELIQSSPLAVERSVHAAIGGAYRSQGITTLELRFNPMKRNRGGERDLDHIIMAAIRGLDRASLEYPQVRAGLILMMDRTFTREQNAVIVEKAIRYAPRGSSASTSPARGPAASATTIATLAPLVEEARAAGLGVTIHVGEEGGDHGVEEIARGGRDAAPRPDRPRHPRRARRRADGRAARPAGIVLEICPTSNLLTKALPTRTRCATRSARSSSDGVRVHDRHRRPGDDAHAPARRVRAPARASARWTRTSSRRRTRAGTRRASSATSRSSPRNKSATTSADLNRVRPSARSGQQPRRKPHAFCQVRGQTPV